MDRTGPLVRSRKSFSPQRRRRFAPWHLGFGTPTARRQIAAESPPLLPLLTTAPAAISFRHLSSLVQPREAARDTTRNPRLAAPSRRRRQVSLDGVQGQRCARCLGATWHRPGRVSALPSPSIPLPSQDRQLQFALYSAHSRTAETRFRRSPSRVAQRCRGCISPSHTQRRRGTPRRSSTVQMGTRSDLERAGRSLCWRRRDILALHRRCLERRARGRRRRLLLRRCHALRRRRRVAVHLQKSGGRGAVRAVPHGSRRLSAATTIPSAPRNAPAQRCGAQVPCPLLGSLPLYGRVRGRQARGRRGRQAW